MAASTPTARNSPFGWRSAVRVCILGAALFAAVLTLWASAFHMGAPVPEPPKSIARYHGVFLVNGCIGALLCLRRAEVLRHPPAYLPGLAVAAGIVLGASGLPALGAVLIFLGSAGLTGLFVALSVHRPIPYHLVMGAASAIWTASNALWAGGWETAALAPWWASFVVWIVPGIRLELATVRRPDRRALSWLFGPLAATIAGLALSTVLPELGLPLVGSSFVGLAVWLTAFDFARDALRAPGLTGYIGICLLSGFAWLSVAGWALIVGAEPRIGIVAASDWGMLVIGFVLFMIFAHAPLMVSTSGDSGSHFSPLLYTAPALVHGALLLRTCAHFGYGSQLRAIGSLGVLAAVVFFAISLLVRLLFAKDHADEAPTSTETTPRPV